MVSVATPATGNRANTEDSGQLLRPRRSVFTRFGTIKATAAHKQQRRPSRWLLLLSANCGRYPKRNKAPEGALSVVQYVTRWIRWTRAGLDGLDPFHRAESFAQVTNTGETKYQEC